MKVFNTADKYLKETGKGDAKCVIFFASNWLSGFNRRVCPVFIRGLKSNPIWRSTSCPINSQYVKNLQKSKKDTYFEVRVSTIDDGGGREIRTLAPGIPDLTV